MHLQWKKKYPLTEVVNETTPSYGFSGKDPAVCRNWKKQNDCRKRKIPEDLPDRYGRIPRLKERNCGTLQEQEFSHEQNNPHKAGRRKKETTAPIEDLLLFSAENSFFIFPRTAFSNG